MFRFIKFYQINSIILLTFDTEYTFVKKRFISLIIISAIVILSSVGVGIWWIIDQSNTRCLGIVDISYLPTVNVGDEWHANVTTDFVPDTSWELKDLRIIVNEDDQTVLFSICAKRTGAGLLSMSIQFDVTIVFTFQFAGTWTVGIGNQTIEVFVL